MTGNRKYRDEDWLREQYVDKKQSSREIAEICGCASSTIRDWLKKHDIETRAANPVADKRLTNEVWLRKQYVDKKQSSCEIAEICGCDPQTVRNWLKKHGIETRPRSPLADKHFTNEDWLRKQYVDKKQSSREIAEICGCASSTIRDWLKKHDIETRAANPVADGRLADEDWLRKQYVDKHQTTYQIAEICGCDAQTVGNWLKKHGIETRPRSPLADKRLTDEDWLRKQYVDKKQSSREIADQIGCCRNTVTNWLEKHDIEIRSQLADKRLNDAEWLRKQYIELEKTMKEIGKECGCSRSVIQKWIHRHDIQSRIASPPADSRLTDESWMKMHYTEKGQSSGEIANICDCSHTVVLDWLRKHGIETRDSQEALPTGNDHPRWTGGEYSYGPGWSIGKKRKVRERDDYICQDPNCSVTQADHLDEYGQRLHVHHLRKAKDVEDAAERNAKENLITLCRDCHTRWEKIADAGLVPQLARDTAN